MKANSVHCYYFLIMPLDRLLVQCILCRSMALAVVFHSGDLKPQRWQNARSWLCLEIVPRSHCACFHKEHISISSSLVARPECETAAGRSIVAGGSWQAGAKISFEFRSRGVSSKTERNLGYGDQNSPVDRDWSNVCSVSTYLRTHG